MRRPPTLTRSLRPQLDVSLYLQYSVSGRIPHRHADPAWTQLVAAMTREEPPQVFLEQAYLRRVAQGNPFEAHTAMALKWDTRERKYSDEYRHRVPMARYCEAIALFKELYDQEKARLPPLPQ